MCVALCPSAHHSVEHCVHVMCMQPAERCVRTLQCGHGRVRFMIITASGDWCTMSRHCALRWHDVGQCGGSPHSTQKLVPAAARAPCHAPRRQRAGGRGDK